MATSCLLEIKDSESKNDQSDKGIPKPPSSCFTLIGCNLVIFGLEICTSAGFTYISPILLKGGFSDKALAFIMGIGPFISLLLVPIIGRWSDRCYCRFGRRRPFMLILGIITIISLLLIPYSYEIFSKCAFINPSYGLAAGVILFDFSSQALMNPCKSLISDLFHSVKEYNSGFTAYSFMLSLGGCIGYLITSLNWSSTQIGIYFGGQEKAVFSVLSILLLVLLVVNLSVAHEQPLQDNIHKIFSNIDKGSNDFSSVNTDQDVQNISQMSKVPNICKPLGEFSEKEYPTDKCLYNMFGNQKSFIFKTKWKLKTLFHQIELKLKNCYHHAFKEFYIMPPVLFRLFIACLFGWMGVMCHDMYYTDFVGQVIYQGRPQAEKESIEFNRYDEGIRMGSCGLLLHCLCSAFYAALFHEKLIKKYGTQNVYLMGIYFFTLSMVGTFMTTNLMVVNVFSTLSGIGLAILTTVPYSLITEYYSKKETYYNNCSLRGVGEDMAVLDVACYLSQIIPSLFLGIIVEYTKSSATYMMVAAVCGAAATYFASFINFTS